MKILRFIQWWWRSTDVVDRIVIGLPLTLVSMLFLTFVFGIKALIAFLILVTLTFVVSVMYAIGYAIKEKWRDFNNLLIKDEDEVIRRLRDGYNRKW